MAAAPSRCNISFVIDYTSFTSITDATASYSISGSQNKPIIHNITPLPDNGSVVILPEIHTPGTYDLTVTLTTADGKVATKTSAFKIGNCNPQSCETPHIKSVNILKSGQIIIDYSDITTDLSTLEYEVATDINFTKIVHSRVGLDNTQSENINNGDIPNNTVLYLRARKYCKSLDAISNWSNVVQFTYNV